MAPRKKSTVFRVTGLSTNQPEDVLEAALKASIDSNLSKEERSEIEVVTAIVPSCYDDEQERVALVEFRGKVPEFLSELEADPLEELQIEVGDVDLNFDRHFFGFTQLYAPKPGERTTAE